MSVELRLVGRAADLEAVCAALVAARTLIVIHSL